MASWIKLVVKQPLDQTQRKAWYSCVQSNTPSGLMHHTDLPEKGQVKSSSYYHKHMTNGNHAYVIPLVRDLVHHEVYQIAHAWDDKFPKVDFVIDYSQPADHVTPEGTDVPDHKIAHVMDAWCKRQHDAWMQDKLNQGWRYGVKIHMNNRTHPWIQPYESLPEVARAPHMQAVKDLLEILGDFGYMIKQKPQA
jgi:hypothetical protein